MRIIGAIIALLLYFICASFVMFYIMHLLPEIRNINIFSADWANNWLSGLLHISKILFVFLLFIIFVIGQIRLSRYFFN